MNSREIISIVVTLCNMVYFTGGQSNVPPGVHPQHYQQQQMHHQQPPVQHMQQQQHHIPMQQQPPVQMQQQQMQMQQQQMQMQPPQMQGQQPMHQQQVHHGHHGGPPQVLNVANIAQEKDHIAEHSSIPIDTSKMTEQELQFHYFKMHDADNNNKLDGCELIKSLIHWHAQGHSATGQKAVEEKLFKDEELVNLIDPILNMDDANKDGFIDYPEFVMAQQKAAAAAGPPPPPPAPHARR